MAMAPSMRAAFADAKVEWVLQAEQLGTGHAVQQAMPHLAASHVLILYADVPLSARPRSTSGQARAMASQ